MNKNLLFTFYFLFSAAAGQAQVYKWVKGGGSNEGMSPSYNYENVTNMCTDDHGNVYITATVGATSITADTFYEALAHDTYASISHIVLASYRCDGTMRWAKLIESDDATFLGFSIDGAMNGAIAYSNGSVYLSGAFEGGTKYVGFDTTFTSSNVSFTARFDTSGQFKWIRMVGPDSPATSLLANRPGIVAVDGQGYIHKFVEIKGPGIRLTSTVTSDTNGTYNLKYDSTGNLVSASRVQIDSVWSITRVVFNKQDDNYYTVLLPNDLYYFTYYATQNSAVSAFRPNGSLIWTDTTGENGTVTALDYKGGNEIYVCGYGQDTFSLGGIVAENTIYAAYYDFATIFRLDTNGIGHWVYNLQSSASVDVLLDVTILPGDKIAATGKMSGTNIHGTDTLRSTTGEASNPLFLVIDNGAHTIKLDQFHGPGNDDQGSTITSDAAGNVYVGGMLNTNMTATGLSSYISHGGNTDFFLVKYGYTCPCYAIPTANYTHTGTPSVSFTYTGTTTAIDSIVWTYSDGHRDTGMHPTHMFVTGTYTVCVTAYTGCDSNKYCQIVTIGHEGVNGLSNSEVIIYPNPAMEQLVIEHADAGTVIRLFNVMGQQVYSGTVTSNRQVVDMRNLPSGSYIVQLTDVDGNRMNRTVAKE